MPSLSGLDAIRNIRAAGVDGRILVLTAFVEDGQVREAIVAGAIGYLFELVVLRRIASGRNSKAIAKTLDLTLGTVKGHVSRVLDKLGVQDRTQAELLALRHGLDG